MRDPSDVAGFIGTPVAIRGTLATGSTLRLDCSVEGLVVARDELVLGETGRIKGEIVVRRMNTSGKLEGDLFVLEMAEFERGSEMSGNIVARALCIREGALLDGHCRLGDFAEGALREVAARRGMEMSAPAVYRGTYEK
jgi:cytoskeletal protein CcmA (bactofilin family)